MHEAKHIPTGLGHGGHFCEDREIVDDKRYFTSLLPCQCLSVAKDAKPCDVSGCVRIEGVHESSGCGELNMQEGDTTVVISLLALQQLYNNITYNLAPSFFDMSVKCQY